MDNKKECQHDMNSPNTTIILSKKRTFTNPEICHGICKVCYKSFTFKRENGKYEPSNN